jgi:hypothetical protein
MFTVGYARVHQADAYTPLAGTATAGTDERRTGPFPVWWHRDHCPNSSRDARMGSIPRSCTEEYEVPAVTVVMDAHASMADVERNNGVQEMTLGKWPKETGTRKEPYRLGKKRCRLLPHQSTSCGPSDVPAPACFGLAQRSWHQSLAIRSPWLNEVMAASRTPFLRIALAGSNEEPSGRASARRAAGYALPCRRRVSGGGAQRLTWSGCSTSLGTDLDHRVHGLGVLPAHQVSGAGNHCDTEVGPGGG